MCSTVVQSESKSTFCPRGQQQEAHVTPGPILVTATIPHTPQAPVTATNQLLLRLPVSLTTLRLHSIKASMPTPTQTIVCHESTTLHPLTCRVLLLLT